MAEIQGKFDVSLPIPIDVTPDFPKFNLQPCQFQIDNNRVSITPLNFQREISYPSGDYEPPKVTEIRVWIIREIVFEQDHIASTILPSDEEEGFEKTLVEATRRFVTIIKHKTNQWDLDTRHPVYAYTSEYSCGDKRINIRWPMEQGSKRMPKYVEGMITWHVRDFQDELGIENWQTLATELSHPISIVFHDELLNDAKVFRSQMRYDSAVMYAAIASELMLKKALGNLLRKKNNMSDKQCDTIISTLNIRQLIKLINETDPSLSVKYADVKKLFELRNKIAHGKTLIVTGQEASEAIVISEQLKQIIAGYL